MLLYNTELIKNKANTFEDLLSGTDCVDSELYVQFRCTKLTENTTVKRAETKL